MTEKVKKIWLEIGDKWNDITLGEEHTNIGGMIAVHIPLWVLTLTMAVMRKTKIVEVAVLVTLIVGALDQAGCDSLKEEITNDLIAETAALRASLNK